MTINQLTALPKYSFSNAHLVYNEEGIQIHREDMKVSKQPNLKGAYPALKQKETSR